MFNQKTVTPKEVLITARNILDTKGWTQNTFAKDSNGKDVQPEDADATCFCALGALHSASSDLFRDGKEVGHSCLIAFSKLEDTLVGLGHIGRVPYFNDIPTTTKEDVLALYDLTIERL